MIYLSVAVGPTMYFKFGGSFCSNTLKSLAHSLLLRGTVTLLPAVDTLILIRVYALFERSTKSNAIFCPKEMHLIDSHTHTVGVILILLWLGMSCDVLHQHIQTKKPLYSRDDRKYHLVTPSRLDSSGLTF